MSVSSNRSAATNRTRKRRQNTGLDYQDLEQRQVLATTFGFEAGTLTVDIAGAGFRAEIDAPSGVEVNGQTVFDSNNEKIFSDEVENIVIRGDGSSGQHVMLSGFFDFDVLDDVTIENVSGVEIDGHYDLNGDLTVDTSFTDSVLSLIHI